VWAYRKSKRPAPPISVWEDRD